MGAYNEQEDIREKVIDNFFSVSVLPEYPLPPTIANPGNSAFHDMVEMDLWALFDHLEPSKLLQLFRALVQTAKLKVEHEDCTGSSTPDRMEDPESVRCRCSKYHVGLNALIRNATSGE